MQRFISAANSKSEKEISYVIDFTGAVIGGTRVSAKLSPEVLRGLAGCAEVSWECPLLSGQFNLPLSHNPEQVRYFVSTPSPFGGNNVSYLVTIVDLTKFVNSEVRNLFVPLLVTLLVIVMLLSLLMYIGLVNYIINPLRHLTVLFEKKELYSKDLLINKTERFPKEVQNVYLNLQKYLLRLEAETIKNEQMQKEMLAAKGTEAIAHKMVTAHGGKIWCESSPEIGVEFHFTLPAIGPELVPDVRALPKNSQEIGGRFKSFGAMLPEGDGPTQHELSCKK